MRGKRQEVQHNREDKKATDESIEAGRRSLLRGHTQGLGNNQPQDHIAIGQAMAARAGSNEGAFNDGGIYMPDVGKMQEDIKDEAEQKKKAQEAKKAKKKAAGAGGAGGGGEGGSQGSSDGEKEQEQEEVPVPGGQPKKGSKDDWLDVGIILKAARAHRDGFAKLWSEMEKAATEAIAAINAIKGQPHAQKELLSLKWRLGFVLATLGYQPVDDAADGEAMWVESDTEGRSELDKLINEVSEEGGFKRPPCVQYNELQPLISVKENFRKDFSRLEETAKSKEDVALVTTAWKQQKEIYVKLKSSMAKAVKDLKGTQGSAKRVAKQADNTPTTPGSGSSGAMARPSKQARRKRPVFEAAQSLGVAIKELGGLEDASALAKEDFDKPYIVRNTDLLAGIQQNEAFNSTVAGLKKAWPASPLRASHGRAAQPLLEPAATAVQEAVIKAGGDEWVGPGDSQDLQKALAPSIFLVAAGKDGVFQEKDSLACLRLTMSGHRDVCLAAPATWIPPPAEPADGAPAAPALTSAGLRNLFLGATAAEVAARKSDVYWATVGPKDVLYCPPGFIVCESVPPGAAADVFGVRVGFLPKAPSAAAVLLRASAEAVGAGQSAAVCQAALKALGVAPANVADDPSHAPQGAPRENAADSSDGRAPTPEEKAAEEAAAAAANGPPRHPQENAESKAGSTGERDSKPADTESKPGSTGEGKPAAKSAAKAVAKPAAKTSAAKK